MGNPFAGFWSYVREDDEAEGGRILRLANDIKAEYELRTAEEIDLFVDREGISWGDRWRDVIDGNLESVAFFIPIMTPRYFLKKECRREFALFANRAKRRGLKDLLLPVHYVDVPALSGEPGDDDLVDLVGDTQWEDWRELRLEEVHSKAYRQAVSKLVGRLVEANKRAEAVSAHEPETTTEDTTNEEAKEPPGTIDRMARIEETFPKWTDTIHRLTGQTEVIQKKMERATSDLTRGGPRERFSFRLPILRRLAREMDEPTSQIATLAREYVSHLDDVDDGLRAIFEEIPTAVQDDPELVEDVCQFFGHIRGLSEAARTGVDSVQQWVNSILPMERMSRDLRPRFRKLRQALMTLVDARGVTEDWIVLMEASGVDCQDFALDVE